MSVHTYKNLQAELWELLKTGNFHHCLEVKEPGFLYCGKSALNMEFSFFNHFVKPLAQRVFNWEYLVLM